MERANVSGIQEDVENTVGSVFAYQIAVTESSVRFWEGLLFSLPITWGNHVSFESSHMSNEYSGVSEHSQGPSAFCFLSPTVAKVAKAPSGQSPKHYR